MRQSTECYSSSTPHWWGSWDMWLQRMSVRFTCCGTSCLCLSSDFSRPPVPSVYWLLQRACPPSVPSATAPGETAATDGRDVCGGAVVAATPRWLGRLAALQHQGFFLFFLFFARGDAERFLTQKKWLLMTLNLRSCIERSAEGLCEPISQSLCRISSGKSGFLNLRLHVSPWIHWLLHNRRVWSVPRGRCSLLLLCNKPLADGYQ